MNVGLIWLSYRQTDRCSFAFASTNSVNPNLKPHSRTNYNLSPRLERRSDEKVIRQVYRKLEKSTIKESQKFEQIWKYEIHQKCRTRSSFRIRSHIHRPVLLEYCVHKIAINQLQNYKMFARTFVCTTCIPFGWTLINYVSRHTFGCTTGILLFFLVCFAR